LRTHYPEEIQGRAYTLPAFRKQPSMLRCVL
jgi:hypothetical protein